MLTDSWCLGRLHPLGCQEASTAPGLLLLLILSYTGINIDVLCKQGWHV